jgi:hypothetical protein
LSYFYSKRSSVRVVPVTIPNNVFRGGQARHLDRAPVTARR